MLASLVTIPTATLVAGSYAYHPDWSTISIGKNFSPPNEAEAETLQGEENKAVFPRSVDVTIPATLSFSPSQTKPPIARTMALPIPSLVETPAPPAPTSAKELSAVQPKQDEPLTNGRKAREPSPTPLSLPLLPNSTERPPLPTPKPVPSPSPVVPTNRSTPLVNAPSIQPPSQPTQDPDENIRPTNPSFPISDDYEREDDETPRDGTDSEDMESEEGEENDEQPDPESTPNNRPSLRRGARPPRDA